MQASSASTSGPVRTRRQAIEAGDRIYLGGRPCKCGSTQRYVTNTACVPCAKADARAAYATTLERIRAGRARRSGAAG